MKQENIPRGDKAESGPEDKRLYVSDGFLPLALSIFNFQLDSAAARLEQRRMEAWRMSG